jgi:hypothetical protein
LYILHTLDTCIVSLWCMSAVQPHTAIFPCPYSYKNDKGEWTMHSLGNIL